MIKVCFRCLEAIESREGMCSHKKIFVDENDMSESTCYICGDSHFDELYVLDDKRYDDLFDKVMKHISITEDVAYTAYKEHQNDEIWGRSDFAVYFCQVYRDEDYEYEIDYFILHDWDLKNRDDHGEAEREAYKYVLGSGLLCGIWV